MRTQLKVFLRLSIQLLLLCLAAAPFRAAAQPLIGISSFPSSVGTNQPITYQVTVTNQAFPTSGIFITNAFSAPVMAGFTNNYITQTNFWSEGVLFVPGPLNSGPMDLRIFVTSSNAITLTNFITVTTETPFFTIATNFVTAITNATPGSADLEVSIHAPPTPVLVNDDFSYRVAVTNRSAGPVSDVFLTNTLPTGLVFRNPSASNRADIAVGTLAANGGRTFQLQVRATNSGPLTVSALVGAAGFADTNTVNNVATNTFNVEPLVTGVLIATNAGTMTLNLQNALMEQTVRLVNIGSSNVDSARVIVSGLTNWLRNAVGTNDGNPYVAYTAPLAAGEGVDLVLQYFVPSRQPIAVPDSSYTAVPTSAFEVITSTNFTLAITNQVMLPSQDFMIEFPAIPGRTYTILYSDTADFASTYAAQPPIVAQADKVQWIDSGPPKTISSTNSDSRFYRVLLNP